MFRSIASKLIIYSLLWIGFSLSLFGYSKYESQSDSLHEQLEVQVHEVQQRLKINLPVTLWNFDTQSLLENIRSEVVPRQILAVVVYDSNGEEQGRAGNVPTENIRQETFQLDFETESVVYEVGIAHIFVNEEPIEKLLSDNLFNTLTEMLFLAISLSVVLYLLIRYQVTKPLSVLELSMKEIASHESNLYRRIEIKDDDDNEVARVSNNFNSIISRIEKLNESVTNKNLKLSSTIEDLQATQRQLIESEKLASLGSLVAGVAHEINTPVGVGITASTTLIEYTDNLTRLAAENKMSKKEFESGMEMISDASKLIYLNLDRVAKLVNSFKQVAVDRVLDEPRNVNLGEFTAQILDSIRPTYKHHKFSFKNSIESNVIIKTHPGFLAQIVTNLLVNAAIHGFEHDKNGTIEVKTEINADETCLIVSDTGKGMSKEIVEKIFEPFFTTRRNKGGTGLGLHIVHNIVTQKLNGIIQCTSIPEEGTEFRVSLPSNLELTDIV